MADKPLSEKQLNAMAREAGFPDYVTWKAWNKHRSDSLKRPRDYTIAPGTSTASKNWLQQLMGNMYPPTLLQNVSDAYGKATGT